MDNKNSVMGRQKQHVRINKQWVSEQGQRQGWNNTGQRKEKNWDGKKDDSAIGKLELLKLLILSAEKGRNGNLN